MIYLIGDSHVFTMFPYPLPAPFKEMYFEWVSPGRGPTAHNLINENSASGLNRKIMEFINHIDKQADILIFSFGEIDCRFHFYNQYILTSISISDLIDTTIERYKQFIDTIQDRQIKVILLGIPPCGRQDNIAEEAIKYYPLPAQQANIYKIFNDKMRKTFGEQYIDIYSMTKDKNGFIANEYIYDLTHVNNNIWPFIKDKLIALKVYEAE